MSCVADGVLRTAMKAIFAADGIGDGTATPFTGWQFAASASGGTSVATIRTNNVAGSSQTIWDVNQNLKCVSMIR